MPGCAVVDVGDVGRAMHVHALAAPVAGADFAEIEIAVFLDLVNLTRGLVTITPLPTSDLPRVVGMSNLMVPSVRASLLSPINPPMLVCLNLE